MTLRVTFVLPDFFAGGAQRVLLTFAGKLDRLRFAPSIVVLNGQGPWRETLAAGLPVRDLGRTRLAPALPALAQALRAESPDIVLSTMNYLNFAVLACQPFLDRKVQVFVREANTPWCAAASLPGRAVAHLAYRLLYRRAHGVISPSNLIARELARDFGVPESRIRVLRNPVDTDALRAAGAQPRRHAGAGRRFVAVGRLSRQKGYDRLIDTMSEFGASGHLTIFGEGPERSRLEEMISAKGLGNSVTLAGFDPAPAPWVAGADALLLPSRWEGLPNTALEALALDTPVIATPEAGAIAEIAAAAKPGAVTLAAAGAELAAAMKAVRPNPRTVPAPSLLPKEFGLGEATRSLEQLLLGEASRA